METKHKIIFITGASAGFGKAITEKFSYEGWDCIVIARRKEKLDKLKSELESKYGNKIFPLILDVTNREDVEKSIKSLPDEWKRIDVLVNNAGLAIGASFNETSIEDIDQMINVNIKGVIYISEAIIPLMKNHKKEGRCQGHIINIGSIAGKNIYQNGAIYCMTKHALLALTRGQRIDLLKDKIKVTSINPGAAETEFSIVRFKGDEERAKKVYENYAPLYAEDIADSVFYCTSTPDNVCVNDLTITCLSQADVHYIHREKNNIS